MKFYSHSKIMKITSYAEAEYSSTSAYGESYLPYEIYTKYKKTIDNITMIADDLDGEYSSINCVIEIKQYTLEELMEEGPTPIEDISNMEELNEPLYEKIASATGKDYPDYWQNFKQVEEFDTMINNLITPKVIHLVLDNDTVINDLLIDAGSHIKIQKKIHCKLNEILVECNMDAF